MCEELDVDKHARSNRERAVKDTKVTAEETSASQASSAAVCPG